LRQNTCPTIFKDWDFESLIGCMNKTCQAKDLKSYIPENGDLKVGSIIQLGIPGWFF
jgi:exosome complex RNA-binding protein Rrp4